MNKIPAAIICTENMAITILSAIVRLTLRLLLYDLFIIIFIMVPKAGLEPARSFEQQILSLQCLPIPPLRLKI